MEKKFYKPSEYEIINLIADAMRKLGKVPGRNYFLKYYNDYIIVNVEEKEGSMVNFTVNLADNEIIGVERC